MAHLHVTWLNVQFQVSNVLGKLSRKGVLFHASDIIFIFVVLLHITHHLYDNRFVLSEGWYYIVRRMVPHCLHCKKDGTTLSEGWYYIVRRMVLHCLKDGPTLSEGWFYIVRRMVLHCQKDGTTLSEGWYYIVRRMLLYCQKDCRTFPHFYPFHASSNMFYGYRCSSVASLVIRVVHTTVSVICSYRCLEKCHCSLTTIRDSYSTLCHSGEMSMYLQ